MKQTCRNMTRYYRHLLAFKYPYSTNKAGKSHLINPYTQQLVSDRFYLKDDEMFTKLTQASAAYYQWKDIKLDNRIDKVKSFVTNVIKDKQMLKPIIAAQIGKSYQNIQDQFQRISKIFEEFIESGRNSLRSQIVEQQNHKLKKVSYEPVGLSLIFPYFSEPIFDSLINLIPCLITGNGALIKSSDYNHFLGPYLETKANQSLGVKQIVSDLFIQPNQLSALAEFRSIKKVIYSGTQQSANSIFETLVKNRFIDCNLFFGGQDAAFVDETADLDHAVKQIVKHGYYNNGQSYDSIKRLYLHSKIEDEFIEKAKQQINKITFGNPILQQTILGPLFSPVSALNAQKLIGDSVSEGAICEIGGLISSDGVSEGLFFEPTLLRNCTSDMIIVQTQLNAPIICTFTVNSVEEFCQQVNSNEYGTGIRIFTKKEKQYDQIIKLIDVGRVAFNSGSIFENNLPIQGWRKSGKGKLLSKLSYEQYFVPKSYNIKKL